MRVGAVVLAAGASSRLGEAKQLAMLGGERLLERAVRVAKEAGCAPVVVVLGSRAAEIEQGCRMDGVLTVRNDDWAEGMASSIRAGLQVLSGLVDAALVMGCDQPAVSASHLRALMNGGVVASAYAGRRGIPACFPADVLGELMLLRGDTGARELLQAARAVELPDGELDVDTVETLAVARARYG